MKKSTRYGHVPMRTCVACRCERAKREMVRIVRTVEGEVEVDRSGKKPGRGVYLCPIRGCWETGLKRGHLEHALRVGLSIEEREKLIGFGQTLTSETGGN